MSGIDLNYKSRDGVHAILMPMTSRRMELRVIFKPTGAAYHDGQGNTIATPWLELNPATWTALPDEGEFASEPFASGTAEDNKGPIAIIQAMMDLGYKLGLRPRDTPDRTDELKAVRYHLEDLRTLLKVK